MIEKRKHKRFQLSLEAQLLCNLQGKRNNITLKTKDISCEGAYLQTKDPLPEGTECLLDVYLVRQNSVLSKSISSRLSSTGVVIRQDEFGMAIQFDSNTKLLPLSRKQFNNFQ